MVTWLVAVLVSAFAWLIFVSPTGGAIVWLLAAIALLASLGYDLVRRRWWSLVPVALAALMTLVAWYEWAQMWSGGCCFVD